jgi:hypothetical protein
MSVETLVLLALFIVVPLIQQLIRATRQRNQRLPEPSETRPRATLARTPPPEVTVPPLVDGAPPAASDATPVYAPVSAVHAGGRVAITPTPHFTLGQRAAVDLRARRDLSRAFVLVAILGPCRANSFHRSARDE